MTLLCCLHILTSSVIYYWKDAKQHRIYSINGFINFIHTVTHCLTWRLIIPKCIKTSVHYAGNQALLSAIKRAKNFKRLIVLISSMYALLNLVHRSMQRYFMSKVVLTFEIHVACLVIHIDVGLWHVSRQHFFLAHLLCLPIKWTKETDECFTSGS